METLPQKLKERISLFSCKEDYDAIMEGFGADRPTTFRVNPLKSDEREVRESLQAMDIPIRSIEGVPMTYGADRKDEYRIKGSDLFYHGKIYLQGIASMLPALILDPKPGDRVLDATAAPGSKTTQMAVMMGNSGEIVACEKHRIRFDKLAYNVKLQGATCVRMLKTDALELGKHFNGPSFDRILLDAPCSAEGRIDIRNERSYGFWSLENIRQKQDLQIRLMDTVLPLLKPGGTLIYSTCTLAPEENEWIVAETLRRNPQLSLDEIPIESDTVRDGLLRFEGMVFPESMRLTKRILPSQTTEGFFVAKIRKRL